MTGELVLTNARIVTADAVVSGTLCVRQDRIEDIQTRASHISSAIDLEGDYLLPGFVELHTDNLEKHFSPRPGVVWPGVAAVVAHDAQIASAGITTVFDAVALGDLLGVTARLTVLEEMVCAIRAACAHGALRAEHLLHLRCEISDPNCATMFSALAPDPLVRLVSVMDHTPGQRQFTKVEKYKLYYQKKHGLNDAEFEDLVARQTAQQKLHAEPNRHSVISEARSRGLALASHDDATEEHVEEAVAAGMTIAEFPTTLAAARAAQKNALAVLVGGPNLVLGGSHSGNIAAIDLAREGMVQIVSSDYVPASMVQAPFVVARGGIGFDLPAAVRMVSRNPARAVGLQDRGEIAPGLRADLVRVREMEGLPLVRTVWREGRRIV
jgi:alpha-D-ribose 1-methylphosphonate 5-triphosphate diphosphatase